MNIWTGMMINSNQNMKWSHINNESNDGMDNDPKPLGEGYSPHSLIKDVMKWIQRKNDIEKLTCELSPKNILDKMTIGYQYTCSMMENTMHIHTYAYFSFYFIFFPFSFFFIFIFFLHIHKCTYPKHKLSPMRRPSQTKGLWINVHGIDNGNDVAILHVMNWGGSPLRVERI